MIIKSEELFKNPKNILAKTFKFLDLPNYENITFKRANQGKYPKMDSRIRIELTEYFRPYNQQLYDYLGINFNWED